MKPLFFYLLIYLLYCILYFLLIFIIIAAVVWHKQITKNWMNCTRNTRIKVCLLMEERNFSHQPWGCEFYDTWTCVSCLGFEILAFPCNQFGGQEPGTNEEIKETACTRFKAKFPIFDKVICHNLIVINESVS